MSDEIVILRVCDFFTPHMNSHPERSEGSLQRGERTEGFKVFSATS